jgi:hypothetical protein
MWTFGEFLALCRKAMRMNTMHRRCYACCVYLLIDHSSCDVSYCCYLYVFSSFYPCACGDDPCVSFYLCASSRLYRCYRCHFHRCCSFCGASYACASCDDAAENHRRISIESGRGSVTAPYFAICVFQMCRRRRCQSPPPPIGAYAPEQRGGCVHALLALLLGGRCLRLAPCWCRFNGVRMISDVFCCCCCLLLLLLASGGSHLSRTGPKIGPGSHQK